MKKKLYNVLPALVLCMGAFLMPLTAHAQGGPETEEQPAASASVDPEAERDPVPFTPDGQATVVDHATEEDGKEFYTFTTPEGNVFYLVIDSQREEDNVYFLNAVTEADLMALAEESSEETGAGAVGESAIPEMKVCICQEQCAEGWADVSCPVCKENPEDCKGKAVQTQEPEEGEEKEPVKAESGGNSSMILFILLSAAVVGGAGYYLKIYKPKHDLDDAEDLDELLGEDGQEVNEDDVDGSAEASGSGDKTAWNRDAQAHREMPGKPVETAGETEKPGAVRETGETAAGAGDYEDTALYDDYPEEDYSDGPDDRQEG
ncbi:MAG: DUF4366 domain-containing protein [Lachnospiraceae bacterium]|nr:DUF4366 domain-containing protein [Lachnospiraceae bacterium]